MSWVGLKGGGRMAAASKCFELVESDQSMRNGRMSIIFALLKYAQLEV